MEPVHQQELRDDELDARHRQAREIDRAYPKLDLAQLLNANGQSLAAQDGEDAGGCGDAATNEPGDNASEFTVYPSSAELAASPSVEQVLRKLELDEAPIPAAPTFLYNGIDDELAHIQPVDQLVAEYCESGASVDCYRDLAGVEHVEGLASYWSLALQYIEDRFASDPVPDSCGDPDNSSAPPVGTTP